MPDQTDHGSLEARRHEAVLKLGLLDSPPEERFDRVVQATARALRVPICQINLVTGDRQWAKATFGEGAQQVRRADSLCARAVASRDIMVVADALQDPELMYHPMVVGFPGIRAYAAVPLEDADGLRVGTLSVADPRTRVFSPDDLGLLRLLAGWAAREVFDRAAAGSARAAAAQAEEIALAREELQRLVGGALAPVALLAPDLTYVAASPAWLAAHRLPPDLELAGRAHAKVFPRIPRWLDGYAMAASGRPVVLLDDEVTLEDGSAAHVRWSASPWGEAAHGKRGLFLVAEVSGRSEPGPTEMDLAQNADQVPALLSAISFDVRTPLQAILGMADLLWDTRLDSEQREMTQAIRRAGERLAKRLDALLGLDGESPEEDGKSDYDLGELLERVSDLMASRASEKGAAFIREVTSGVPLQVEGDPRVLGQLLLYFCGLAVDAAASGLIALHADLGSENGQVACVEWAIHVPGAGLPGPWRAEWLLALDGQDAAGTAGAADCRKMGIQVADRLVQQLAGRLWATPTPDGGLVFRFTTQFKPVERRGAELPPLPAQNRVDDRPLRILVVEDQDDNRMLVRAYLRRTPYAVEEAADGREGFDRFMDGSFDLVLMDMEMPVMDGYAAVTAMRQWERDAARPPTPILALTAHARQSEYQRSLDVGCNGHLTKPVRRGEMLEAIRNATRRSDMPGSGKERARP